MSYQVLNSKVVINSSLVGDFSFSGVHEVRINRSIHSVVESCMLTIPSIAKYVPKNGSVPVTVTTGTQFADGDAITISLGYDLSPTLSEGEGGGSAGLTMTEEFRGFVKRRDLAMPLVVECEGYVRQLRLNNAISADFTKTATSAKKLLELACQGTDITVECPVDFPLIGIKLVNADGLRICDYIKEASDHTLTIFFKSPTVLWCGLTYTAYAAGGGSHPLSLQGSAGNRTVSGGSFFGLGGVGYRIGYNTVKDNQLKQRIPSEPVQIIMNGKLASGVVVNTKSKADFAKKKVQSLVNHVPDNGTVAKFAQEKEYLMNYTGYEGKVMGFGVPFALPGYNAFITDSRYPELDGTYVIESTDVQFGVRGFRRVCEIGPMVNFSN